MNSAPQAKSAGITPTHRIYCNRALNLRSVKAIGYDMDYTLIHYHVAQWEKCAYGHLQEKLLELGWPVGELRFDPEAVIRGLIIDRERGNLVKANQFGFIKLAAHGTHILGREAQRSTYSNVLVDLSEDRWVFLNTLFSLSEAVMYAQLVDLLDAGALPRGLSYGALYEQVRVHIDAAHMEGQLKADIIANPDRFVDRDPAVTQTLLDQRAAGKKLLLITNSEWSYTQAMMDYAIAPHLPSGMQWRELFDLVIVGARKPAFFWESMPLLEIVDGAGLARPIRAELGQRGVFLGGNAELVERQLGLAGPEILYVGDHIFGDVHVSKGIKRWRTALIVRELEHELEATLSFDSKQHRLDELMDQKVHGERELCRLRLALLDEAKALDEDQRQKLKKKLDTLRSQMRAKDADVAPLAIEASQLNNPTWGLITRAGNDKSHLAQQIERHADVYTSRVSNFCAETPFAYFRPPSGRLPHDAGWD